MRRLGWGSPYPPPASIPAPATNPSTPTLPAPHPYPYPLPLPSPALPPSLGPPRPEPPQDTQRGHSPFCLQSQPAPKLCRLNAGWPGEVTSLLRAQPSCLQNARDSRPTPRVRSWGQWALWPGQSHPRAYLLSPQLPAPPEGSLSASTWPPGHMHPGAHPADMLHPAPRAPPRPNRRPQAPGCPVSHLSALS